jgi:hypothetical protein
VLLDQGFAVLDVGGERWRRCGQDHGKQQQPMNHNFCSHGARSSFL